MNVCAADFARSARKSAERVAACSSRMNASSQVQKLDPRESAPSAYEVFNTGYGVASAYTSHLLFPLFTRSVFSLRRAFFRGRPGPPTGEQATSDSARAEAGKDG